MGMLVKFTGDFRSNRILISSFLCLLQNLCIHLLGFTLWSPVTWPVQSTLHRLGCFLEEKWGGDNRVAPGSAGLLVKQFMHPLQTIDFSPQYQTLPGDILHVTYWGTGVCSEMWQTLSSSHFHSVIASECYGGNYTVWEISDSQGLNK